MTIDSKKLRSLFGPLALAIAASTVVAQNSQPNLQRTANPGVQKSETAESAFSEEEIAAIDVLRALSDDIQMQSSTPDLAIMQARIADLLWDFDEGKARLIFRRAFDAASQPINNISSVDLKLREEQLRLARRQAAAMAEVLRLLGKHDPRDAEKFLSTYGQLRTDEARAKRPESTGQAELFAQIALELSEKSPEQAQRFGILSLAGREVPASIGKLLFALSKHAKSYSDPIFVSTIGAMRRNGHNYSVVIDSLCNYVFYSDGRMFSKEYEGNARVLIAFLLDAARNQVAEWREFKRGGAQTISTSAGSFHFFFVTRALPIIRLNAADNLQPLQAMLDEMSSGLSQQQLQEARNVASIGRQRREVSDSFETDLEDQLRRAENEKDVAMRDNLWRTIAIGMMRGDSDRALSIAAKIDDEAIQRRTEDDITLVIAAEKLKLQNLAEAQRVALNLNDLSLKARTLGAIADASKAANGACDLELLSEAQLIALKDEIRPEKVSVLLSLATRVAKCDPGRGFEFLSAAVNTTNQLPATDLVSSNRDGRSRVLAYTMVGGQELSSETQTTRDSLNFDGLEVFAKSDFTQTQYLGYQIQDRIFRSKYLISLAQGLLQSKPQKPVKVKLNRANEK